MRLFMSVDLVGSTAFKASKAHSELQSGSPLPRWVDEFRTFYKDFPIELGKSYRLMIDAFEDDLISDKNSTPRVWKTIGDEIIFCSRVSSIEHTAASVAAFLKALECYSRRLEKEEKPLRLKGAGWLAAFPAPNISISIMTESVSGPAGYSAVPSENTEDFECEADTTPSRFDFLGKGIDTGFRIAKNASEDRFATSVQLAYVLARAATKKKFPYAFGYHGREALKGVIDGEPYPVVSVDTERSEIKSKLKSREAALTGDTTIKPHALCDFLKTFMEAAAIDLPCLGEGQAAWSGGWPESYIRYQRVFEEHLAIDNGNVNQIEEAVDPEHPDDSSLDESKSFLGKLATSVEDDLQDRVDALSAREFRAHIGSCVEDLLPAAMADRILTGESPVRVWREHRGLSTAELAKRAGIKQPYLSQIESGKRDGGIQTIKRLAQALGVAIDDLV
ncbi:helix-turn-helix domain-containing protein [Aquabacter sp. P-9]|uniref:helix-turn-helix domain-containing protein n=1 Tax=Aquabacter sediminis TaxID=3029197 RepID=UPI00237D9A72|nr:helix-turn-helix transcriptional regulator [Aquabacter sp. P-9]MDE1567096.1 helix-turn-helix transcriptional regulator [Aquabacter sp. P-9]